METIFKQEHVGCTVYHSLMYGKGIITSVEPTLTYPIVVKFDHSDREIAFTEDGKLSIHELLPTLSFEPYIIDIAKDPRQRTPKIGELIMVTNDVNATDHTSYFVRTFVGMGPEGSVMTTSEESDTKIRWEKYALLERQWI